MNRIRFQVEAPKAGAAARVAEQDGRTRSSGSLAGSAARAAEQSRHAEQSIGHQANRMVRMRATGGKVFQPEQPQPASASAAQPPVRSSAAATVPQDLQVLASTPAEDSSQPGPLQTAVSRVHSLVRSFFPRADGHTLNASSALSRSKA